MAGDGVSPPVVIMGWCHFGELADEGPAWCVCMCAKSLHLCPILCSPMDCSLPGSFVRKIL